MWIICSVSVTSSLHMIFLNSNSLTKVLRDLNNWFYQKSLSIDSKYFYYSFLWNSQYEVQRVADESEDD